MCRGRVAIVRRNARSHDLGLNQGPELAKEGGPLELKSCSFEHI
jgi:hypothetical protein